MPFRRVCPSSDLPDDRHRPWFLFQLEQIVDMEEELRSQGADATPEVMENRRLSPHRRPISRAKAYGFSDYQIAHLTGVRMPMVSPTTARMRHPAGIQAGGYLRGGIPGGDALLLFHL
jgi:hypothetical protein